MTVFVLTATVIVSSATSRSKTLHYFSSVISGVIGVVGSVKFCPVRLALFCDWRDLAFRRILVN